MMRRWLGATPAARVARIYAVLVLAIFAAWPLLAYSDEIEAGWRWTGADVSQTIAIAFAHDIQPTPRTSVPCIDRWNEEVATLPSPGSREALALMPWATRVASQLRDVGNPRVVHVDASAGACTVMLTDGSDLLVLRREAVGWRAAPEETSWEPLAREGGNVIPAPDGTLQATASTVSMPWRVVDSGGFRSLADGTLVPTGKPVDGD